MLMHEKTCVIPILTVLCQHCFIISNLIYDHFNISCTFHCQFPRIFPLISLMPSTEYENCNYGILTSGKRLVQFTFKLRIIANERIMTGSLRTVQQ